MLILSDFVLPFVEWFIEWIAQQWVVLDAMVGYLTNLR